MLSPFLSPTRPCGYFPALLFNACSIASSLLLIESSFSNISVLTVANFLDNESRRSSTTAASSAGAPGDLLLLVSSALSPGVVGADLRCGTLEGGGEGGDIA